MAVHVYKLGEGPRATREKRSRIETTDEWQKVLAHFANGIGIAQEVAVTFRPQDIKRLGLKNVKRTFLSMTNKQIKKMNLPYSAETFKENNIEVIRIFNEPILTSRAPREEQPASEAIPRKRRRA